MIQSITHVGIIVSDIRASIRFYQEVLGMRFQGEMEMGGSEADLLFGREGVRVKLAYLSPEEPARPPLIELIEFSGGIERSGKDFSATGIAEICLIVQDIEQAYRDLSARGVVFLSPPQLFDYSSQGFGRSKAVYLKDPDGTILELLQTDL